jgi:hypothetical protein
MPKIQAVPPPLPSTGESRGKAWPRGPAAGLRLTKLTSTKERMWAVEVFLETWLWDSNMDSKTINFVDFTASKKKMHCGDFQWAVLSTAGTLWQKVSEISASDN